MVGAQSHRTRTSALREPRLSNHFSAANLKFPGDDAVWT